MTKHYVCTHTVSVFTENLIYSILSKHFMPVAEVLYGNSRETFIWLSTKFPSKNYSFEKGYCGFCLPFNINSIWLFVCPTFTDTSTLP